jgi:hypothetical protein
MNADENKFSILENKIYHLIQSSREFRNKLVSALKEYGFEGISVDPCLWVQYSDHGIVMIPIYVDDCLVTGNDSGINNIIDCLKIMDLW